MNKSELIAAMRNYLDSKSENGKYDNDWGASQEEGFEEAIKAVKSFIPTSLRLDGDKKADKDKIYSEMTEIIQEQLFTYKAIEDVHIASDLAGLIMTKFMAAKSLSSSIVYPSEGQIENYFQPYGEGMPTRQAYRMQGAFKVIELIKSLNSSRESEPS